MKVHLLLPLLLLLSSCTIRGVDNEEFWTDKYYKLAGTQISDVIDKIGFPTEIVELEGNKIYIFNSIRQDYIGRFPSCELKLMVSKEFITKVEIIGSEGSCSEFKLDK